MSRPPRIFGPAVPMLTPEASKVDPLDPTNPLSILTMVTPKMRVAIEDLDPKFANYCERDLRRAAKPSPEVCRLRINFWDEYNKVMDAGGGKITIYNIIRGACTEGFFYDVVMKDPKMLAYVTIPPADYQLTLRDMLTRAWDRLDEVLETPLTTEKSIRCGFDNTTRMPIYKTVDVVNIPLIGEIRAITQMLDLRIKGAIIQRLQVQSHNVTQSLNDIGFENATLDQLEAMEKRVHSMAKLIDKSEKGALDAANHKEAEIIANIAVPDSDQQGQEESGDSGSEDPSEKA